MLQERYFRRIFLSALTYSPRTRLRSVWRIVIITSETMAASEEKEDKKDNLSTVLMAASALTSLGPNGEERAGAFKNGSAGSKDVEPASSAKAAPAQDSESPNKKRKTNTSNAPTLPIPSERHLPSHKKANAALTFPEKVRQKLRMDWFVPSTTQRLLALRWMPGTTCFLLCERPACASAHGGRSQSKGCGEAPSHAPEQRDLICSRTKGGGKCWRRRFAARHPLHGSQPFFRVRTFVARLAAEYLAGTSSTGTLLPQPLRTNIYRTCPKS